MMAVACVVAPVPPLAKANVPPAVIVPDEVTGPPENVRPVEPPETSTDVTVPVPPPPPLALMVTFPVDPDKVILVPAIREVTPVFVRVTLPVVPLPESPVLVTREVTPVFAKVTLPLAPRTQSPSSNMMNMRRQIKGKS